MSQGTAGYRWQVLGVVTLTQALGLGATWWYVIMVAADLRTEFGFGGWGTLWSGISFGILLASIPAGALGDRLGVRKVVSVGLLLVGVALLLRAGAERFGLLLATMVLFGGAMALVGSNLPKTLGIWFEPQRLGLANGVSLAGFGAGSACATLLPPVLLEPLGGWRTLTRTLGLLTLVIAVIWWLVIRDRSAATVSSPGNRGVRVSIRRVLRVRDVWIMALCYLLFFGGHLGTMGYLPIYFEQVQGMSRKEVGTALTVLTWCYVLGSLLMPWLSDRIGLRKVVYVSGVAACCVGCLATAFLTGAPLGLAMAGWGVAAGATGLLFVVPLEMAGVGPRLAGTAVGVTTTSGFLGGVAIPLIGIRLASIRPLLAFTLFAVCFFSSAVLFTEVRETGHRA